MAKWKNNKKTETEGIIFLENIINENNCIYRSLPGDKDTGIDGFIELVNSDQVTGELIGVQVKSGNSYFDKGKQEFRLRINAAILKYWLNYSIPVILFFYSPSLQKGVWIPIKEFVEQQKYLDRVPVKKITASLIHELTINSFSELRKLAKTAIDSRNFFSSIEKCLSNNDQDILENFSILAYHPYSRGSKTTLLIAKNLLKSKDEEILKIALYVLGHGAGRMRWSWNPQNKEEQETIEYTQKLCKDLDKPTLYKLLCIVDNEYFNGPDGLGERYLDLISCCDDTALPLLEKVAGDKNEPNRRRMNALNLYYECNQDLLKEAFNNKTYKKKHSDLFKKMFGSSSS